MIYKHYINVSFKDKDLAKKLGAKWDDKEKKWFYYENDNPLIDEEHNNYLPIISQWFPPRIEYKKEIIYVRFKTGNEILDYLDIKKENLYRLKSKDKDLDGCMMLKGKDGHYDRFFMDIYAKSDLNSEEIHILEQWLIENFPFIRKE